MTREMTREMRNECMTASEFLALPVEALPGATLDADWDTSQTAWDLIRQIAIGDSAEVRRELWVLEVDAILVTSSRWEGQRRIVLGP